MGVVAVQAIGSVATVVQLVLYAAVLPRGAFDTYSVWVTSGMFLVGVAQAVGADRVLVGRRSYADGLASVRVLAAGVVCAQVAIACALGAPLLALCSLALLPAVVYDFRRLIECFEAPRLYVRRDVVVLAAQVAVVLAGWALLGQRASLVLGWWLAAAPVWWWYARRRPRAEERPQPSVGGSFRAGVAVLRGDARESAPLLVDSALGGAPVVVALALVHAQGAEGDASAARMALTILGPLSIVAVAGRRMVYRRAAGAVGRFGRRFLALWAALVVASWLVGVALLALTRTPAYPFLLPSFDGLPWVAIAGFALIHASVFASMPAAARLRAAGRATGVGAWRVASMFVFVAVAWGLAPVDGPTDVAWAVAAATVAYAVGLSAHDHRTVRRQGAAS